MKTSFIDWLKSLKLVFITVLVLISSYSLVDKPVNWIAVIVFLLSSYVTLIAYKKLKKNDNEINFFLSKNEYFVSKNKEIFKYIIVINAILLTAFCILYSSFSFLQIAIMIIYFSLSIIYCLARSIKSLSSVVASVAITTLSFFSGIETTFTLETLTVLCFAVYFMLLGRSLFLDVRNSKDKKDLSENKLRIVVGSIAIILSLIFCSGFIHTESDLKLIAIFYSGFSFVVLALGFFVRIPNKRRTSIRAIDVGIIVMFIAIVLPALLKSLYLFTHNTDYLFKLIGYFYPVK